MPKSLRPSVAALSPGGLIAPESDSWASNRAGWTSRSRHRSPHVLACVEDFVRGRRYQLETITTDPSVYMPEIKRP